MTTPTPSTHVVHHLPGDGLGKMIGPLPLGAWVAIIGGGLAFTLYTRHAATASAPASSNTPPVDTSGGVGTGVSGQWVDVSPPTTSSGTGTTDVLANNDQWEVAAIDWLIGKGYDPGLADSAIRKYMGGSKLSVSEYALVREALMHLGSPPTPLPASLSDNPIIPHVPTPPTSVPGVHQPPPLPKPKPNPAPRPTTKRVYVTKPGDTLWSIATHYYHNPLRWVDILHANPGKIPNNDPRRLGVGTQLVIP